MPQTTPLNHREILSRGQTSGQIAATGRLFRWRVLLPETTVIEFTRAGQVVQRIEIPATGWKAFQAVSHRRGVQPESWLTTILGEAMSRDVSIEETLNWLFPTEKDPAPAKLDCIQRFESMQRELHGEGVAV